MSTSGRARKATSHPSFEQGTGFLLSRLGTLASRAWSEHLREHELTLNEYTALVVAAELGPLGQLRLAQLAAVDPRNVVALVDTLADRGLVTREIDPDDRRRRLVAPTANGRRLLDRVARRATTQRNDFLDALSPAEQRQLNRLLQRLYDAHTADE
jgi:DNA-binding MarR family transcriptional regulator